MHQDKRKMENTNLKFRKKKNFRISTLKHLSKNSTS